MPTWETLLLVNVGLLLAGSFLEPPAAILILTPLLLPIVEAVGVNPIHFGIIMAVNLEHRPVHAAVRAQPVRRRRRSSTCRWARSIAACCRSCW